MMHRNDYLKPLEIIQWQTRTNTDVAPAITPASSSWDDLRQCVANCVACPLHQSRTQTVFGVGNTSAKLMVIGEAPGFNEDQQGEPFVGRAGQLLTAMLQSIGLKREEVFIANILKCRPPENRNPNAEEIAACATFLKQQIALLQPALILATGRVAAHALLHSKQSMESLRGIVHTHQASATPLIVTYHPAYLLRSPSDKKKAYLDLKFTIKTLASIL